MALFKDTGGQLVIAATLPAGGTAVAGPTTANLIDTAPWLRSLDAANTDWHPANYYAGSAEVTSVGVNGFSNAIVFAYQRSAVALTSNPGAITYDFSTAQITTASLLNGWVKTIDATIGTDPLYVVMAFASSQATTISLLATAWNAPKQLSAAGLNGTRTAIMDMYQYAAAAPTVFPVGSATYTWATGQFTAPATSNGWSLTPPAPVAGQTLWIARTTFADSLATATTAIPWSSTVAIPLTSSGVNGQRTAVLELYMWAAGTPTVFPQGSSTYTWATGAFTLPATPNTWSLTPGAAVQGAQLWSCEVVYTDTGTSATTVVTWPTTNTALSIGYAGMNGSNGVNGANGANGANGTSGQSARVAYVVNTSSVTPGVVTAGAGDVVPTSVAGTWSFTATSTLTAGQYMYQVDGLYNPATNATVWGNPYLSNLKVGSLSALAADLGTVTISATGALATAGKTYGGATPGVFIGYNAGSYVIDIGTPAQGWGWNGSSVVVNGQVINSNNMVGGSLMNIAYSEIAPYQFTSQPTTANGTVASPMLCNLVTSAYAVTFSHLITISWTFSHADVTPGWYIAVLYRNNAAIHSWTLDPGRNVTAGSNLTSVAVSDVLPSNGVASTWSIQFSLRSDAATYIWNVATLPSVSNIELIVSTFRTSF